MSAPFHAADGMITQRNVAAEQAKAAGVKRVREMLEGLLPSEEREEEDGGTAAPGKDTSVIVNQLACAEAGCPDVEVVMTLLRAKPRPKLMFKLYKTAADLTSDEVESALRAALAEEQGKEHAHEHGDGHDHGHADGHAGGHAGGDCCGHEHGDDHEHGHADGREGGHTDCGTSHKHGHESDQAPDKQHEHGHT